MKRIKIVVLAMLSLVLIVRCGKESVSNNEESVEKEVVKMENTTQEQSSQMVYHLQLHFMLKQMTLWKSQLGWITDRQQQKISMNFIKLLVPF